MTIKELINKLSLLDDNVEVKIGYGDNIEPINFIFPEENNCIVLHPDVYGVDKNKLWERTLVYYHKE